jgi:hypothetical protein
MAINIFQGSKQPKATVNSASASSRAQAAKESLAQPAETSTSGSVAVGTTGTLGKVGNTIGKVAGLAAKFLPGVGGMVAKVLSDKLNDPEWWQSVPGDAVTLNQALRPVGNNTRDAMRIAFTEFMCGNGTHGTYNYVMYPTDTQITQYLLPQVRKVVNAVPLQSSADYNAVLQANATVYAIWRQAKKMKYMLTHGQTYIPSLNDTGFPLFQTQNSAFLDSVINRTEEYLRANVRLPHTLCEYLAWRYGRVYKVCDSLKAGCVVYNVIDFSATPSQWDAMIRAMMAIPSNSPAHQAANADLYNTYFDHDLTVDIKDETQFTYDPKEFALRTNLDIMTSTGVATDNPNFIYLDSKLDNPTAFMASSISTAWYDTAQATTRALFPVTSMRYLMYVGAMTLPLDPSPGSSADFIYALSDLSNKNWQRTVSNSLWFELMFETITVGLSGSAVDSQTVSEYLTQLVAAKACEVYNKDLLLTFQVDHGSGVINPVQVDASAPNYDMALVQDYTIEQEQVYAFANLVDIGRKHSMSYKQAEKLVTKEAANLIEKMDVAAVQSPAVTKT